MNENNVVAHMHIVWTDGEETLAPIYEQDEDKRLRQILEEYCNRNGRNIHAVEDYWTEN
jgi:coproporphyrinogen III oxidase